MCKEATKTLQSMTPEERATYGFFPLTSRELSAMGYHRVEEGGRILFFEKNGKRKMLNRTYPRNGWYR